ncbi:hypothetical protein N7533_008829 [Penicillium manginii]|uniref:uncharacterized protein n=1 Tax=Penicillium manginii TaxID=203109 RepID=UPI0025469D31|nr:uncharacterized protein N7533_008829 [Penicillium manginii]KAJ5743959.1 hypothetical protein N7533_008829 [Penicillium manginii]
MDPLTAIGLAGNILAFIDFSYKVISGVNKVLSSPSGMTSENESLSILVVDLNLVTQKLSTDIIAQTENEKQLCALAGNCHKLSEELNQILGYLKLGDKHSKWDGLRVKWRSMRKEKEIDAIERRLNGYQSQILIRLQVMFSQHSDAQNSFINDQLEALRSEGEALQSQTTSQLDDLHQTILALIQSLQINPAANMIHGPTETSLAQLGGVLERLVFDSMYERENYIENSESGTFAWMIDEEFESIDDQGVAPIQPQDKIDDSEMVSQRSHHKRVKDQLEVWSVDHTLIFVRFFFWNSGDKKQMSLEGLYRSLLFEICRQLPSLIPRLFPDTWRSSSLATAPIRFEEVKEAFGRLIEEASSSESYFCFFIDGLDEFEGDEVDHWHLCRSLKSWTSQTENIKLCVSSRPHVAFMESLAMFENDPNFDRVKNTYRDLVIKVVDAADGVFLWARLAVRSLLKSIGYRATEKDLKKQIDLLPKGLDELFNQILESIDPNDCQMSDQLFLLVIPDFYHWRPPVRIAIAYSWLEELGNSEFPYNLPLRACTEAEFNERLERVSCLLDRLSQGLLEMKRVRSYGADGNDYFSYEVGFLHRSVREYISITREAQMCHRVPEFDAYSGIFRLLLASFKFAPPALHNATQRERRKFEEDCTKDLLRRLKQQNATSGPNLLLIAALFSRPELVQQLLHEGRNPEELVSIQEELHVIDLDAEILFQATSMPAHEITPSVWLVFLYSSVEDILWLRCVPDPEAKGRCFEELLQHNVSRDVLFLVRLYLPHDEIFKHADEHSDPCEDRTESEEFFVFDLLEYLEVMNPANLNVLRTRFFSETSQKHQRAVTLHLRPPVIHRRGSLSEILTILDPHQIANTRYRGKEVAFCLESVITPSERLGWPFAYRLS